MYACALNQFHDAGDEHLFTVADGVHLDLFADVILVNQNGFVFINFYGVFEIMTQRFFAGHNLHGASAEHEAGTDEDGIADSCCCFHAAFDIRDRCANGMRDAERSDDLFKRIAVFGAVDGLAVCADDAYAARCKRGGEVDGCLPAERADHTAGLFQFHDIADLFYGQRLKIELIGGGIVGGYGFGVIVDDDGFVSRLLNGMNGVDGGVIKFHALTNAYGA